MMARARRLAARRVVLGLIPLVHASALAERPAVSLLSPPTRVHARKMALITPDLRRSSAWLDVGGIADACWGELVFDCFEPIIDASFGELGRPTDGANWGGYDPACLAPGARTPRYRWGQPKVILNTVNDMHFDSQYASQRWGACEFAWLWYVTGPGSAEDCYVVVWTADAFDDTCTGPPASGYHEGVVFWYGQLRSSWTEPDRYYWDFPDVCSLGGVELPNTSAGAYHLAFANAVDENFVVSPATSAQPMLWGNKDDAPGSQGAIQWDDDTAPFGVFTAECYSYDGLVDCPNPLGAMWCCYAYAADPCAPYACADCNCDGSVNGFDIDYFIDALNLSPAEWENAYPGCDRTCVADTDGDNAVNGFDIDGFIHALNTGTCP